MQTGDKYISVTYTTVKNSIGIYTVLSLTLVLENFIPQRCFQQTKKNIYSWKLHLRKVRFVGWCRLCLRYVKIKKITKIHTNIQGKEHIQKTPDYATSALLAAQKYASIFHNKMKLQQIRQHSDAETFILTSRYRWHISSRWYTPDLYVVTDGIYTSAPWHQSLSVSCRKLNRCQVSVEGR